MRTIGWFRDFLEKPMKKAGTNATILIDIPPKLYFKELALYTAISLISNAISKCEFKTYLNHKEVKENDYYILNVSPNENETSSFFWHKVVEKMIRDEKGALVVELNGKLYCAESFNIKEKRPILGNIYENVRLDGLTLNKKFTAREVYLFKMENRNVKALIDGMYEEYSKLLESAARAFRDTNGRKFKFKVSGTKQGDEEFNEEFNKNLAKNIKEYMENDYATYVEYEGEELEEQINKQQKNSDDFTKIRKDIFDLVGQAFKIPQALMTGTITSVKDVIDEFLTFGVDPLADNIEETLNKRATMKEYIKGNFYKANTETIKHRDIFDNAKNIMDLIGSGSHNIDEVREKCNLVPLNTDWSQQYFMTKNLGNIEEIAKEMPTKGGEKGNEKNDEDSTSTVSV